MTESNATARAAGNRAQHRNRSWEILIIPALILMTLVVFWGIQNSPFLIMEEDVTSAGNDCVKRGMTLKCTTWALTNFEDSRWQPLTWLSLMLDVELQGDAGAGSFRFTSVLLHLGAVLLLYAALSRLTGEPWPSALVAALFAIHPQHIEPVVWLTERKSVLAAFFGMGSIWAWIRYCCFRKTLWYMLSLTLFVCCLLSGQTLIALPLLFPLFDKWRRDRAHRRAASAASEITANRVRSSESSGANLGSGRLDVADPGPGRAWRTVLPFLVCSILVCVIVCSGRSATVDGSKMTVFDRSRRALVGSVSGLVPSFVPQVAATFVPPQIDNPSVKNVIGAALLLGFLTLAVATVFRPAFPWCIGWSWYLAMLIPPNVIGPLPVGQLTDSDMYIPQIGLFVAASWTAHSLACSFRWGRVVLPVFVAPVFLICLASGFLRVNDWRDDDAVFANPPIAVRLNNRAHYLRSMELLERTPPEVAAAFNHLQLAVQLDSHDAFSHARLGQLYRERNQLEEAARHLQVALQIDPDLGDAHWNLGIVRLNSGQPHVAELHFRELVGRKEFPQAGASLNLAIEYQSPRWQQLRRIEALGGHYKLAAQDPRSPIVMLSLVATVAGDADLAAWQQFTQLESLDLNGTHVTDKSLPHLKALTELRTLELNSTGVTNNGLVHLRHLTKLQTLALGFTEVDGRGLPHLDGLRNLTSLVLGGAQVTDVGLDSLSAFPALRKLNLSRTRISDAGLRFLTELPHLESLELVDTRVTDAGLAHIEKCGTLQSLNLVGTNLTGSGLQHLRSMKHLRKLALDNTQVDNAGLEHIAALSNLEVLTIANTRVNDAGLKVLRQLTRLRQLNLGGNPISDSGLVELQATAKLEMLDLSCSQVTAKGIDLLQRSFPQLTIYR